ncbi:hypothetical protein KOI35_43405 [Actinoplanes bogorensis]|uniref:Secreted protein n=1 Tax=Paractinoplanes bogorensis TaxID=1610840 RepID=A0ABS5Z4Q9_9ACTN|nr:HAD domain-containing protein [Actinoplanes bogorensis]MBU2670371.1 hypothetical protein [Actinoplanes bogorensis]
MIDGRSDQPLLFLDVDGPLIPFRARAVARPHSDLSDNPLVDRLDPADGRRLIDLGCQLVWATTWMADANEVIAPRLGLPALPIVDFPDDDDEPRGGLHWKTSHLTRWAAERPFIWLDDEITDTDWQWVRDHYQGAALLHRVDPFAGLSDADFATVRRWLETRRTSVR